MSSISVFKYIDLHDERRFGYYYLNVVAVDGQMPLMFVSEYLALHDKHRVGYYYLYVVAVDGQMLLIFVSEYPALHDKHRVGYYCLNVVWSTRCITLKCEMRLYVQRNLVSESKSGEALVDHIVQVPNPKPSSHFQILLSRNWIHPSTKSPLAGAAWNFSLSQARQLCSAGLSDNRYLLDVSERGTNLETVHWSGGHQALSVLSHVCKSCLYS